MCYPPLIWKFTALAETIALVQAIRVAQYLRSFSWSNPIALLKKSQQLRTWLSTLQLNFDFYFNFCLFIYFGISKKQGRLGLLNKKLNWHGLTTCCNNIYLIKIIKMLPAACDRCGVLVHDMIRNMSCLIEQKYINGSHMSIWYSYREQLSVPSSSTSSSDFMILSHMLDAVTLPDH